VLAASAAAIAHGISPGEIASVLTSLEPPDKRGQVLQFGNIAVINDCYNSSPKALMAAVDTLAMMPAKRRIVVAGEMLELGATGEQLHRECGRFIAEKKMDFLLGVRGLAQAMVDEAKSAGMRAEFVTTPEEAGVWLTKQALDGDVILLKASRGVKLERALDAWKSKVAV
jgi:UDP-N-acetylmuramoyl-tripeptide--D-alanyl-D-alanine ligase